jgi:NitT/TauT family transport system ATP-binding protein
MSFLKLQHIHHTYFTKENAKIALRDVSLDIEEGEFISFLGPSGCGKTTLLSIIAGLLSPTIGSVYLSGQPLTQSKDSSIGYMLQQDYLFPWKTIKENILIGLKLQKKDDVSTTIQTLQLLQEIGLQNVENQFPKQLSGGMRQRVALVRTLATNPKLLLLDEPFSALDYQTKLKLEDLLSSILKTFQKTAILVTHDIGEAICMSDRVVLLAANPGRIHQIFTIPDELRIISPFQARNHPLFPSLFQKVWKEFEKLEQYPTEY